MRNKWYKCKIDQINSKDIEFKTSHSSKSVYKILDFRKNDRFVLVANLYKHNTLLIDRNKLVILAKPV